MACHSVFGKSAGRSGVGGGRPGGEHAVLLTNFRGDGKDFVACAVLSASSRCQPKISAEDSGRYTRPRRFPRSHAHADSRAVACAVLSASPANRRVPLRTADATPRRRSLSATSFPNPRSQVALGNAPPPEAWLPPLANAGRAVQLPGRAFPSATWERGNRHGRRPGPLRLTGQLQEASKCRHQQTAVINSIRAHLAEFGITSVGA